MPKGAPRTAPRGAAPTDAWIVNAGGPGYWLGDLSMYENDDPVPAPLSLSPVALPDVPPGHVPPAPAGPQYPRGAQGSAFGPRAFPPGEALPPAPLEGLEPIPDERFRLPGQGLAGGPEFSTRPGQFAAGQVALYPHVATRDVHKIAPGAVPVVVAVRHPEICPAPCLCHRERVAFVQIWAPPFPARKVQVKRHGGEVKLDYGPYEVEIESRHGHVSVEYDH